MSYCVHCGVELADSEEKCPLCFTPVCDPSRTKKSGEVPLYPEKTEFFPSRINRRFLSFLFSLALLIPFGVVIVIDLLTGPGKITWSLYVLGAEICLWTVFVFPVLCPGIPAYVYILLDYGSACLYLLLIETAAEKSGWFVPLALPLTLSACAATLICAFILQRKKSGTIGKLGWICFTVSFLVTGVDVLIKHYVSSSFVPGWSLCAAAPLLVFSILLIIISKSARVNEWIKKNLFV